MKNILNIIVLLLLCIEVSAQNFKSSRMGLVNNNGSSELVVPVSTIEVDVLVEMERVTPGVYARYAQKFLALRAPLTERTTYKIVSASINLAESNNNMSESVVAAEPKTVIASLPIDQVNSMVLPAEDAARQAAESIFMIRRQRRDIISGEAGEGYFGAGLEYAIKALDDTEAEYIKLFTGEKRIEQSVKRFTLTPTETTNQYMVARFSSSDGLLSENNLAGVPVYLQTKVAQTLDTSAIEADPRESKYMWFRVAAPTDCTLYNDAEVIASSTLPLYEYGKSIKVKIPKDL